MDKYQLCNKSIELLDRLLKEMHASMPIRQPREDFIYRHANNILILSRDILFLDQNNRASSNFIIIRPVFESLFNLVAAAKDPSYAIEKMNDEAKHAKDKIERWIKYYGDSNGKSAKAVSLITNLTQALHCHFFFKQRKWNTFEVAKKARLDGHYFSDYSMFSANIHANIHGIIAQEKQVGRQRILQLTIHIVHITIQHVVRISEFFKPELYINESMALMNELNKMAMNGDFKEKFN